MLSGVEFLKAGTRVERIKSPADSLVRDGVRGSIVGDPLQADNGQLGYFVRFPLAAMNAKVREGFTDLFCAGSRLRAVD